MNNVVLILISFKICKCSHLKKTATFINFKNLESPKSQEAAARRCDLCRQQHSISSLIFLFTRFL